MTALVYALRERGTIEPRYIGRTSQGDNARFRYHLSQARSAVAPTPMQQWLNETGDGVEQITVAECSSDAEAMRIERETVHACLRLGFRLFNVHLAPATAAAFPTEHTVALLSDIERFCAEVGWPDTKFGMECLRDKPFVSQLRAGRDVRASTAIKVRAFISRNLPEQGEAA